jgi:hypothetical protein
VLVKACGVNCKGAPTASRWQATEAEGAEGGAGGEEAGAAALGEAEGAAAFDEGAGGVASGEAEGAAAFDEGAGGVASGGGEGAATWGEAGGAAAWGEGEGAAAWGEEAAVSALTRASSELGGAFHGQEPGRRHEQQAWRQQSPGRGAGVALAVEGGGAVVPGAWAAAPGGHGTPS